MRNWILKMQRSEGRSETYPGAGICEIYHLVLPPLPDMDLFLGHFALGHDCIRRRRIRE